MLSGCPELDGPWDPEGRPISIRPVERRHLEMAKRNIEERFIVAAPIEEYTALVWFLKRLYGWPFHRVLFRIDNETPNRPKLAALSEATRKRLETLNQYDIEVFEWVKARFAKQIQSIVKSGGLTCSIAASSESAGSPPNQSAGWPSGFCFRQDRLSPGPEPPPARGLDSWRR
jgi:hypothetical protein